MKGTLPLGGHVSSRKQLGTRARQDGTSHECEPIMARGQAGQLLVKRVLDAVAAGTLFVSLLPLLLIVALLVRCSSPRPILVRRRHVGKHGHHFWMYKFRTMVVDGNPSIHEAYSRSLIVGA